MLKAKNTPHKLTALALALVLAAGMTACGNKTDEQPVNTQTPTEAATETPSEPITLEEPEVPADDAPQYIRDMEGRVFKFASGWEQFHTKEGLEEPDPAISMDYEVHIRQYDTWKSLYDNYNCDFENLVIGGTALFDMFTTSVLSGDPIADMATLQSGDAINAAINNLLISYNSFLPADHDVFTTQLYSRPACELQNTVWTVEEINPPLNDAYFLGVNMDIIRAAGAPNPAELYDRGEWTVDNFLEVLRLTTKDTNGDGSIDQYGLCGHTPYILQGLMAANGAVTLTQDMVYAFDSPQSLFALDTMNTILAVDKTFFFDPRGGADFNDYDRNMNAYQDGTSALYPLLWWMMPNALDMSYEFSAVPFPAGPDYDGHSFFSKVQQGQAIPRGADRPEDIFFVWELYANWHDGDTDLIMQRTESVLAPLFENEDDMRRILYDVIAEQGKLDLGESIYVDGRGYIWVAGDMCKALFDGTGTPAQVAEMYRQPEQDMINVVFGPLMDGENGAAQEESAAE